MTLMPTFLAGANWVMHSAGWLEGGLVAGYEKFIVDIELLQMMQAEFTPLEIDEESLAFGAHEEVGSGGHFLGAAHTMERFRTCFYRPLLSSSENYERWTAQRRQRRSGPGLEDLPGQADDLRATAPRRRRARRDGRVRQPTAKGARRLMAPVTVGRASANASTPTGDFVIVIDCPDRPGIVHAVSGFLLDHGGNIVESQQFGDTLNGRFFMRIDFTMSDPAAGAESLRADFTETAARFDMSFEIWGALVPYRTLIMVSRSSCTASTTCSSGPAPATCRSTSPWWSSTARRRAAGAPPRPRLPSHPGHSRDQGGRRGRADGAPRGAGDRSRRARPLHAGALGRRLPASLGPGDQHPPLVPAQLQGRTALPPGLRARREADRGHRPLRHRRPRRGADHRAGRHPRRPRPQPGAARRSRP